MLVYRAGEDQGPPVLVHNWRKNQETADVDAQSEESQRLPVLAHGQRGTRKLQVSMHRDEDIQSPPVSVCD